MAGWPSIRQPRRLPTGTEHGPYPFAWAVLRLRGPIGTPGWSWRYQDDDAMAAMYVMALHHLMWCWGQHPLLARLAQPLAERDRFIRTVTGFAAAKLLHDAGNRVGFSLAGGDVGLHFTTAADEPLSLALTAPESLQWPQRTRRSPEVLRQRGGGCTGVGAGTGEPGTSGDRGARGIDPAAGLRPDDRGRDPRGVPDGRPAPSRRRGGCRCDAEGAADCGKPDQIAFGYAFYPIRNPRFAGENPIKFGP